MKCPDDNECLTCVGTTCTCGDCKDAQKPCTEQRARFLPSKSEMNQSKG